MTKQVVVRTYPHGWLSATTELQNYLNIGYRVVLVNKIINKQSVEVLEYILEKQEEEKYD